MQLQWLKAESPFNVLAGTDTDFQQHHITSVSNIVNHLIPFLASSRLIKYHQLATRDKATFHCYICLRSREESWLASETNHPGGVPTLLASQSPVRQTPAWSSVVLTEAGKAQAEY